MLVVRIDFNQNCSEQTTRNAKPLVGASCRASCGLVVVGPQGLLILRPAVAICFSGR